MMGGDGGCEGLRNSARRDGRNAITSSPRRERQRAAPCQAAWGSNEEPCDGMRVRTCNVEAASCSHPPLRIARAAAVGPVRMLMVTSLRGNLLQVTHIHRVHVCEVVTVPEHCMTTWRTSARRVRIDPLALAPCCTTTALKSTHIFRNWAPPPVIELSTVVTCCFGSAMLVSGARGAGSAGPKGSCDCCGGGGSEDGIDMTAG